MSDSLDLNELRCELFSDLTETVEKSDFTTEFLKLLLTSDSGARLKLLDCEDAIELCVEFTKEVADLIGIGRSLERSDSLSLSDFIEFSNFTVLSDFSDSELFIESCEQVVDIEFLDDFECLELDGFEL